MIELNEKAGTYAEKNVINVLKEAFAKVYADGYRDGYKDCKEEIAVDLQNGETEFVDLGLPSGTLWSADYEKKANNLYYIPYCKAELLNIPTEEQWEELRALCKWEHFGVNGDLDKAVCIGPNGESVTFPITAMEKCESSTVLFYHALFWLKDDNEDSEKKCADMAGMRYFEPRISRQFSGYKLPVRLVRKK